jgi:hypothetical protein
MSRVTLLLAAMFQSVSEIRCQNHARYENLPAVLTENESWIPAYWSTVIHVPTKLAVYTFRVVQEKSKLFHQFGLLCRLPEKWVWYLLSTVFVDGLETAGYGAENLKLKTCVCGLDLLVVSNVDKKLSYSKYTITNVCVHLRYTQVLIIPQHPK